MLDLALPRLSRAARDWFTDSPLESSADPYVQYLLDRGYAPASIRSYVMSVAHFAHWLTAHRRGLNDLDETLLEKFVRRHLPVCRCADRVPHLPYCVRPALLHLLRMLRIGQQIAPWRSGDPPMIVAELREFDNYLTDVRGLCQTTRYARMIRVRAFLLELFGHRRIRLDTLRRADIVGFMARYTANWRPQSKQCVCSSVRSYFRFKAISGVRTASLSAALPMIAHWKLATLPKGLSAAELTRLLGAFDRTCASGRRDYAITRCFADLGLRTAEVARLQLDDVDWQRGMLRIRGKGRRVDVLPLPPVTGRAIVAYLRAGRPRSDARALFLRHRPPVGKPATRCIVRNAVRFAATRCGLQGLGGPHILRHTVATRLVQGGATLKQVADVLRHRCLDTTSIYAKVDIAALSSVAMPWPGRRS